MNAFRMISLKMAASVKYQWFLVKYAKFVIGEELNLNQSDNEAETLDVPCKGRWKVYIGNNKDLTLSYLESDHLLILHKDVILESFSLINSDTWLKGVARRDSLMILNKLKDGNNRRFRIQFDGDDNDIDGPRKRKQCTELLKRYFPISDYDDTGASNNGEIANIDKMIINKLQLRKAYTVEIPKENLKEMIMLCLTDSTFPSYVDEVDNIIKSIGK